LLDVNKNLLVKYSIQRVLLLYFSGIFVFWLTEICSKLFGFSDRVVFIRGRVGNFFRAELSEVSGDVCVCGHFEKRGLICEQLA